MTDIWKRLAIEFPPDLERQYQGRGNRTFTYIEPRDVMERLDEVLTPAGWKFETQPVNDHVAHGRLSIKVGDEWIVREDFGYPNNAPDIAESLKEAQSDALRRCAMGFGIARYLYRRDTPHTAPRPAERPRTAVPAAAPVSAPAEPVWDGIVPDPNLQAAQAIFGDVVDESTCPDHGKAWRTNSKGYYCATKVGDGWCKRQPSKAWAAAQELVPA